MRRIPAGARLIEAPMRKPALVLSGAASVASVASAVALAAFAVTLTVDLREARA